MNAHGDCFCFAVDGAVIGLVLEGDVTELPVVQRLIVKLRFHGEIACAGVKRHASRGATYKGVGLRLHIHVGHSSAYRATVTHIIFGHTCQDVDISSHRGIIDAGDCDGHRLGCAVYRAVVGHVLEGDFAAFTRIQRLIGRLRCIAERTISAVEVQAFWS